MNDMQNGQRAAADLSIGTRLAWFWAVAFAAAGALGFVPNPLVGPDGIFLANVAHNLVHVVTAAAFLFMVRLGNRASIRFMKAFGVVYAMVGVLGTVVLGGATTAYLLGLVHINAADNYLHLALGAGILISGVWAGVRARRPAFVPGMVAVS